MWTTAGGVAPSAAVAALLMDTVAALVPTLAGGASRIGVLVVVYIVVAAVNIRGTRSGLEPGHFAHRLHARFGSSRREERRKRRAHTADSAGRSVRSSMVS
jgi:hypothetical protein